MEYNIGGSSPMPYHVFTGGNVGIGTTSPFGVLHIKKDNATAAFNIQGGLNSQTTPGTVTSEINFRSNDSSTTGGIATAIKSISEINNGAHNGLAFYTGLQSRTPYLKQMLYFTARGGLSFGDTNTALGSSGQVLKSNGDAPPTWVAASTVIGGPYLPLAGGTMTGDLTISKAATPLFTLLDTTNNISLLIGADDANTFIRSSSTANLYLQPGASTAMTLLASGNVGIGTTAPNQKLHVEGRGVFDGGASSDIFEIRNNNGGGVFGMTSNLFSLDLASTSAFRIRQGGSVPFYLKSDGKIGIGTTAPSQLLHVESTSTNARTVIKTTATGNFTAASQIVCNDSDLFFGAADDGYTSVPEYTGKPFLQGNGGHFAIVAQGDNDDLQFYAGGRGSADKHMVITGANSGRVGIGTNSPSAKLDVNGTANISGAATMAGPVKMVGLSEYANDVAAGNAGLQSGDIYYSVSGGDRVIKMKI